MAFSILFLFVWIFWFHDCRNLLQRIKKRLESTGHAAILIIAVFVNIGIWFIEQFVRINFEMLSVSYIISELFY